MTKVVTEEERLKFVQDLAGVVFDMTIAESDALKKKDDTTLPEDRRRKAAIDFETARYLRERAEDGLLKLRSGFGVI